MTHDSIARYIMAYFCSNSVLYGIQQWKENADSALLMEG